MQTASKATTGESLKSDNKGKYQANCYYKECYIKNCNFHACPSKDLSCLCWSSVLDSCCSSLHFY